MQPINKYYFHIDKVRNYIERENFQGYDPYDTLNSYLPFRKISKTLSVFAIQFQKRNPINIRSFIGIKKELNPKGLGLFLKSYSILYQIYKEDKNLEICNYLYQKLVELESKDFSGSCWGYNFDWASPGSFIPKYTPSVVVTAFVVDGLMEYYKINSSNEVKDRIISSGRYIMKDLYRNNVDDGICISYTHIIKDCCYNASLLGAETLARIYSITKNKDILDCAQKAVEYVISKQKSDGSWLYSINLETGNERKQIDFHQGFILRSLHNFMKYSECNNFKIEKSIKKGLDFYRYNQFNDSGFSLWRIPKKYPIDIHNQAEGIITFTELSEYKPKFLEFAKKIADWTITNMYDKKGYFYYRNYRCIKYKTPYMRWGQAWMFLALVLLQNKINISEP